MTGTASKRRSYLSIASSVSTAGHGSFARLHSMLVQICEAQTSEEAAELMRLGVDHTGVLVGTAPFHASFRLIGCEIFFAVVPAERRRITGDEYDRKARKLKERQTEVTLRIEQHQKGEGDYRTTLVCQ
jgi:hypothetical protein